MPDSGEGGLHHPQGARLLTNLGDGQSAQHSPTLLLDIQVCQDELETNCNLVQDVICRNATETRFDEKCWVEEVSDCKTVYDTVWDKKCEAVNITVPQRDCSTRQTLQMERKCRVVNETVLTPVCVDVLDKEVEQSCEEVVPRDTCYQAACRNVTRPSLSKECREVFDEECEVILEPGTQQQCTTVDQTQAGPQCRNRIRN